MPEENSPEQDLLVELRQILTDYFDEEDLKNLCFDLSIDYQNLPAEGKKGKARELVLYCAHNGRLAGLENKCRQLRPQLFVSPSPKSASPGFFPEQARRYLPPDLYDEFIPGQGPKRVGQCLEHLMALLQTVETYCSDPVLELAGVQAVPRTAHGKWCDATLLFADISGFTAMSEQLNARGPAGVEEIMRIVNKYFAAMVDILNNNGGFLLKFGGDALLGMFVAEDQETAPFTVRDTARYAVQAALDMQREMVKLTNVDPLARGSRLQMKVGVHTGRVFAAHVGTDSQMEYWVTGEDVNLTALAEETAQEGQVVASKSTRQHLTAWENLAADSYFSALPIAQEGEYTPLPHHPTLRKRPFPQDLVEIVRRLDALSPYLPKGLLHHLTNAPHQVENEHRLVAVMFINVEGFSELAAALTKKQTAGELTAQHVTNALTETMQDYFATMQSIVEECGGVINKTDLYSLGDKVLAMFGAPVAHEDAITQAARAALALQATLEQVNQRLATRCPAVNVRLRQRIGLSTGYVFSGNVGAASRQEYTIMGDEVNLAARIMSATRPGEIWVSSHVFQCLEHYGEFGPVTNLPVKGMQEPVPMYPLLAISETDRPKPRFINQDESRAMLQDRLDHLLNEGKIILVRGDPGIGKSRLWDDLRPSPDTKKVLRLVGHCREQQPAYHVIADLLHDYLGLQVTDDPITRRYKLVQSLEKLFDPEQIKDIGPFLAIVMGLPLTDEWEKCIEHQTERQPADLSKATTRFFERLAQDRPLILVCENLHWMDEGSADILLQLQGLAVRKPIMFGFTLRPGECPTFARMDGMARSRYRDWFEEILLGPLSAEDSAQLMSAVAGQALSPEQQDYVYQLSGGNPLFIIEIVHAMMSKSPFPVSPTAYAIIQARVDMLPPEPRQALKAAAVIGVQFSLPELAYMFGKPEQAILRDLPTLRLSHLVDRVDGQEKSYKFTHALVREVVYHGLNLPARHAFHRWLGAYWARLPVGQRAEQEENIAKSADHYFAGELWEQALEYGRRAAEWRRETYAYAESLRLYEQALKAAEELRNLAVQIHLHHQIGEVCFQAGKYEQAAQAHQRELGYLLVQSANEVRQAEVHFSLGRVYRRWGKFEQALRELGLGLELAGATATVARARLLRARCDVLADMKKWDEAVKDGLAAIQTAQQAGLPEETAFAYNQLGAVYGMRGEYEVAREFHQCALGIRLQLGQTHEQELAQSYENIGTALSYLGKLDEAESYYQKALEIQRRVDDRYSEGSIYHNWAWVDVDRGELQAAESKFLRALEFWGQINYRKGLAFAHGDLGNEVYAPQERREEACAHLEQSAQNYESIGALEDALAAARTALLWAGPQQVQAVQELLNRILQASVPVKETSPLAN